MEFVEGRRLARPAERKLGSEGGRMTRRVLAFGLNPEGS
jgi:hypothetical protein